MDVRCCVMTPERCRAKQHTEAVVLMREWQKRNPGQLHSGRQVGQWLNESRCCEECAH